MADDGVANGQAPIPPRRSCAGCDLCCTAVPVTALKKGPSVRCAHLRGEAGTSCSIYDRRPDECRTFLCLWRVTDDVLPDWMAPASAGFVVLMSGPLQEASTIFSVAPDPARPDAWMAARNVQIFKELARQSNRIVVVGQEHETRHIFAPSGKEFSREQHPWAFADGGRRVQVPNSEFLPAARPEGSNDAKKT